MRAAIGAHGLDGTRTDAARRYIDDTLKSRVRSTIGQQTQVGQCILDFGTLKETQPAVDPVGYPLGKQQFLEYPGLGIGPIKYGDTVTPLPLALPGLDTVDDKTPFINFIQRAIQLNQFTVCSFGP